MKVQWSAPMNLEFSNKCRLYFGVCSIGTMMFLNTANANSIDDYLFNQGSKLESVINIALPEAPRLNWLTEPELRISPELDSNNQLSDSYRLRFRTTSRKERKSVHQLFQTETELFNARWDRSLSSSLKGRYYKLIELAQQEVTVNLLRQQLILERSLLSPGASSSSTSNGEAADLEKAILFVGQLDRQFISEHRRMTALRDAMTSINLSEVESTQPSVSLQLISPIEIAQRLVKVPMHSNFKSAEARLAILEVERAQEALAIEKGRTGFGLNMLEFRYNNTDVDSYVLNFGFRLPFSQRDSRNV